VVEAYISLLDFIGRNRALCRGVVISVNGSRRVRGRAWMYVASRSNGSAGRRVSVGRERYVLILSRSSGCSWRVSILTD
jgi:hypothetical protein